MSALATIASSAAENGLLFSSVRWFLCALVWAMVAATNSVAEPQPSHQGKPASYWLDQIYSTNANGMKESIEAFTSMGSNAVPFLVEVLEQKPSKLGGIVDEKLSDYRFRHNVPEGLAKALPSAYRVEQRRESAAFLISQIGPPAAAAVPALMRIFHDQTEGWGIKAEVRVALLSMGEKLAGQMPEFIGYLKSEDVQVRALGATFLERIGPKAKAAIPALLEAAENSNWALASAAARALWRIDRQTNVALRVFTAGLQSTNSTARQSAIVSLRQMGPAAKSAGLRIQAVLEDPDDVTRNEAEKTLREIDPSLFQSTLLNMNEQTEAAVQRLIETIRTGEYRDRYRAVEAIALFGPQAKPAVSALIEALNGLAPAPPAARISPGLAAVSIMNYRRVAAIALAEIGHDASASVPALMALIREHKDGYSSFYCRALARIGPDAKEAVGLLESKLDDENRGVRLAAADALTRIVPQQCSKAVAVLRSLQHDPDLATVWVVDTNGTATPTEQKDFENPAARFFRLSASVSLWRLGLEKEAPTLLIVAELKQRGGSEDIAYVELLGEIGSEARLALPLLMKFLDPKGTLILRRAAAIAIRKIDPGEAARLGLPALLALP